MPELLVGFLGLVVATMGIHLGYYTIVVNGRENRRTYHEMGQILERVQRSQERVQESARHIAELVVKEGERTREEARHPRT